MCWNKEMWEGSLVMLVTFTFFFFPTVFYSTHGVVLSCESSDWKLFFFLWNSPFKWNLLVSGAIVSVLSANKSFAELSLEPQWEGRSWGRALRLLEISSLLSYWLKEKYSVNTQFLAWSVMSGGPLWVRDDPEEEGRAGKKRFLMLTGHCLFLKM